MSPSTTKCSLAEKQSQALNLFLKDISESQSKSMMDITTTSTTGAPPHTAATPPVSLNGPSIKAAPSAPAPTLVATTTAEHQRRVDQNRSHETTLKMFCEALPVDRKLSGNDFEMEYFLRKEKGQRKYTVPETGARLTYSSALGCLSNFTSLLPMPAGSSWEAQIPSYSVIGAPGGFQCVIIMPESSPISNAMGKTHSSKQAAKCSAAFEMCLKLYQKMFLNSHLQSAYFKQLPLMRNANLAISSKKKEEYEMRTKPELWSQLGMPDKLYITVLTLEKPQALDWPSRPLLLLTR